MPLPAIPAAWALWKNRKLLAYGAAAAAVTVLVVASVVHYRGLKSDRDTAMRNEARSGVALDVERSSNQAMRDALEDWRRRGAQHRALLDELAGRAQLHRDETAGRIGEYFANTDVERLVVTDPGAAERAARAHGDYLARLLGCETRRDRRCEQDRAGAAGAPGDPAP